MSVINIITFSWIVHTRYLLQELQQLTTNLTGITMQEQVEEATLYHNTRIDAATTAAAHNDCTPPIEVTIMNLTVTQHIDHITDHSHIEALQVINPEITVGHIHYHHTDLQDKTHID